MTSETATKNNLKDLEKRLSDKIDGAGNRLDNEIRPLLYLLCHRK